MSSRAAVCLVGALAAACGGDGPSARARVLDKIPAGAAAFAARGAALAHPRFRPVVDALRAELPAGFDCVVDAALACDEVAAGIASGGDVTVALVTRAPVRCPALSRLDDTLWVATLGGAAPATGAPVLAAQPRARAFLRAAPVALVATRDGLRVIATAQPEPLAAWVAIDTPDPGAAGAVAASLRTQLARASANAAIAAVAKAIAVERNGSQVVARLGATDADLAVGLREALAFVRAAAPPPAFPCPSPLAAPVLACAPRARDRYELEVYSLASALEEILAARTELVVANGRIEGVRLRDDLTTYGLASGDVVVAVDGKRVTAPTQLAAALGGAKLHASLMIGRAQRLGTIELVER